MLEIDYWLDEYNLLHTVTDKDSENGVLFLTEFELAHRCLFGKGYLSDNELISVIASHYNGEYFKQSPWDNRKASHDNMTAICILAHWLPLTNDLPLSTFKGYWHPRDLSFYLIMRRNFLGYILLPFLSLAMITSCLRTWKRRPDIFEKMAIFIKERRWPPNHFEAIHTDGKFLTWLRCSTGKFPLTWFICRKILQYKFGPYWLYEISSIYFKHPKHPMKLITYGKQF